MHTNPLRTQHPLALRLSRLTSVGLLTALLAFSAAPHAAKALPQRQQVADPELSVLSDSTASEAQWSSIRYSPQAGLALIFSELYPVK